MKYRNTADVDARQIPPLTPGWHEFPPLSLEEIAEWCGGQKFTNHSGSYILVPKFEGDMRAWPGVAGSESDWIVKDALGGFHKVKHADFASNFAPVTATSGMCLACGGGGLVKLPNDEPKVCSHCKGTGLEQS